jgi:hypothetical protein
MSAYGVAAGLGRVVQSGLILYLDAGNSKSIVSGSTNWTDISRNGNNGTLTNGPTYNTASGGCIVFDGGDDFVTASFNQTLSQSYSVCVWTYPTALNAGGAVLSPSVGGYMQIGGSFNPWQFNDVSSSTVGAQTNRWIYLCGVQNVTTGPANQLYTNGELLATGSGTRSWGTQLFIGKRFDGAMYQGRVALVKIYNRALSATEIRQNYNVEKKRFGLS